MLLRCVVQPIFRISSFEFSTIVTKIVPSPDGASTVHGLATA